MTMWNSSWLWRSRGAQLISLTASNPCNHLRDRQTGWRHSQPQNAPTSGSRPAMRSLRRALARVQPPRQPHRALLRLAVSRVCPSSGPIRGQTLGPAVRVGKNDPAALGRTLATCRSVSTRRDSEHSRTRGTSDCPVRTRRGSGHRLSRSRTERTGSQSHGCGRIPERARTVYRHRFDRRSRTGTHSYRSRVMPLGAGMTDFPLTLGCGSMPCLCPDHPVPSRSPWTSPPLRLIGKPGPRWSFPTMATTCSQEGSQF